MFGKMRKLEKIVQKMNDLSGGHVDDAKLSRMYLREAIGVLSKHTLYHDICGKIDYAYSQFGMRRDGQGYQERNYHSDDN